MFLPHARRLIQPCRTPARRRMRIEAIKSEVRKHWPDAYVGDVHERIVIHFDSRSEAEEVHCG